VPAANWCLRVWCVTALITTSAGASETHDVVLRYEAPEGCPSADTFQRGVTARTSVAQFTAAQGTTIRVRVWRERAGFHASLVTSFDGTEQRRMLADPDCSDLVNALALSVALAIDPEARAIPQPARSEAILATQTSSLETAPENVVSHTEAAAAPKPVVSNDAPGAVADPPPEGTAKPSGLHWVWSATVGVEVNGAIGASPLAGPSIRGPELRTGRGLQMPALSASFSALSSMLFPDSNRLAEFTLVRGRVWISALGFQAGPLRLRPNVGLGIGRLSARGLAVADPKATASLWADVALSAEAVVSVGKYLFGAAYLGVVVPLTETTFVLDGPRRLVHQTDSVGALAEIDMGVRFW
jgi:hypothetical protein